MQTNLVNVAAVILTLNEESDLPRALSSLRWCNEIIVVDSGSTDKTRQIAKRSGARVYINEQQGPFLISEQRNWALENCDIQSDWILFLDADEITSPKLSKLITLTVNQATDKDAFYLAPRYWFFGRWLKHCQGFPNWHPRLVRKNRSYFVGGVWESFNKTANCGYISEPYEHYSFGKGIDDWYLKHLRYANWDAQQTYDYLRSNGEVKLCTERKHRLREYLVRVWYLKPALRFIHKYFLLRGFLDGWQGLLFSLMMTSYEIIVVAKVCQHFSDESTKTVL